MLFKFQRASSRISLPQVPEVPPGPLEGCLVELSDFDRLLQSAEVCRQEIAEALRRLRAAAAPLLDSVRQFDFRQHECQDAIARLCAQLDGCTGHLQASEACSHTLQQRIDQARSQYAQAHNALEERKEVWATKSRCDEEAARIVRKGSQLSMEQKSARLKAKHEAEEAFQSRTARTKLAVEACLHDAWPAVQLILAELVHVYSALPMPIEHLTTDADKIDTASSPAPGLTSKNSNRGPPLPPPTISTSSVTSKDFSPGEAIQVWSASQNAWLDGHVDRVYQEPCREDVFTVPAGVVKVTSAAGVKYVRSEHVASTLRKMTANAG